MDVYLSSESEDDEILLLAAIVADDEERKRKKKRKCWVHSVNKEREISGEYCTLMPELRKDPERFHIYFRMTPECFDQILGWIIDDIQKMPTNFRNPIPPSERLAISLRK
ncbi:uncharacterized protein LOC111026394 [Myzus persicae]|uniref:uncharacterized protein LOC111026394 n=1 Tax=Myzus persicae TaxID=13164 RepID=UPI000B932B88|nr:uncharacterized protein LOC111026394 [Myzus persicae]